MAWRQSAALASMAAEDRPSPTTRATLGLWPRVFLMTAWLASSKRRPLSGRVRYSSLLWHMVWTGTKPCFSTKAASTWENTESWAAAWSARIRSMETVLYRAPARPRPSRAGVRSLRSRKASPFFGCSTRYCRRRSVSVMSSRQPAGSTSAAGAVDAAGAVFPAPAGWPASSSTMRSTRERSSCSFISSPLSYRRANTVRPCGMSAGGGGMPPPCRVCVGRAPHRGCGRAARQGCRAL